MDYKQYYPRRTADLLSLHPLFLSPLNTSKSLLKETFFDSLLDFLQLVNIDSPFGENNWNSESRSNQKLKTK